jgi:RNA polymerase sigma-70 factor, ECF subfamily
MSALWAADSRTTADHTESYAAALYERHHSAVFRHCLKHLRRREDADDAVQTTFVYALQSLRRGVVPRTELAWLYAIAGNVCSSSRRARMRRGPLEMAQDVDSLQDVIPTPTREVPVSADDFRSALSSMPTAQRNALLFREWQGLSYNEIADKLGLSQAATETLLFRARRTLARKLEDKAGVGTLHGFSVASLIRSLLQSSAGKTLAVAVSAAAIAVTPGAESQVDRTGPASAVVAARTTGHESPSSPASSFVHTGRASKSRDPVRTLDASVVRAERRLPIPLDEAAGGPTPAVEPAASVPESTTPIPVPATPLTASEEPSTSPVDDVVTTVTNAVPATGLPALPPVDVDDVVPPLPEIPVPSVTVPVSAPPLPIG